MFIRHNWNEQELKNCYRNAFNQELDESRFIGSLVPFLGGLLIGGLFIPKPTQTPNQIVPPMPVYPQPAYYLPNPIYSTMPPIYPLPVYSYEN